MDWSGFDTRTELTTACGGASAANRRAKAINASTVPAASITTWPPAFWTHPVSPNAVASRTTNGRKPTPWTEP